METTCFGCGMDIVGKYRATYHFPKKEIVLCEFCQEVEPDHKNADWQKKE